MEYFQKNIWIIEFPKKSIRNIYELKKNKIVNVKVNYIVSNSKKILGVQYPPQNHTIYLIPTKNLLKAETFTENQVLIFNAKLLLSPFESAVLFALNKFRKYANFLLNLPEKC